MRTWVALALVGVAGLLAWAWAVAPVPSGRAPRNRSGPQAGHPGRQAHSLSRRGPCYLRFSWLHSAQPSLSWPLKETRPRALEAIRRATASLRHLEFTDLWGNDQRVKPTLHYFHRPLCAGQNLPLCGDDPDFLIHPPSHQPGLVAAGSVDDARLADESEVPDVACGLMFQGDSGFTGSNWLSLPRGWFGRLIGRGGPGAICDSICPAIANTLAKHTGPITGKPALPADRLAFTGLDLGAPVCTHSEHRPASLDAVAARLTARKAPLGDEILAPSADGSR